MSQPQNIPFLDLVTPHVELEAELTAVFQKVIRSAGFIGGPMVEGFEKEFAAFCQTSRSVAVNSGTDALRFALMAAASQLKAIAPKNATNWTIRIASVN